MATPITATTIILARHAERSSQGSTDPHLSAPGRARAQKLIHVLGTAAIKAIYTSHFIRTKETAQPLAAHLGLSTVIIDEASEIKNNIESNHSGKTVLVIGHTDTVPQLISLLGGASPPVIEDDEFDNLFIVNAFGSGRASVVRLKYGDPS
ncbi:MAG TPA: phosphoglycerate mutase family protein [Pyrinomonadaceae bacterium]|jgi:phosphohistidine phosphatase SixA